MKTILTKDNESQFYNKNANGDTLLKDGKPVFNKIKLAYYNYLLLGLKVNLKFKNYPDVTDEDILNILDRQITTAKVFDFFNIRIPEVTRHIPSNYMVSDDFNKIRFISLINNKTYITKIGKLYSNEMIAHLNNEYAFPLINYMADFLTKKYIAMQDSTYQLVINQDFEAIYNKGTEIDSCMVGDENYKFYMEAVDASAVSLQDDKGDIFARCILFNEVFDNKNTIYRYAERIYARSEYLKHVLLNKLINANKIDIYKVVGASCHNITNIKHVDGRSFEYVPLHINCNIDHIISFQDTFIFYNSETNTASNNEEGTHNLNRTDLFLTSDCVCVNCGAELETEDDSYYVEGVGNCCEDCVVYDDISQEYILASDSVEYYDCGQLYYTHEDNIDDKIFSFNNKYYHKDSLKWDDEGNIICVI